MSLNNQIQQVLLISHYRFVAFTKDSHKLFPFIKNSHYGVIPHYYRCWDSLFLIKMPSNVSSSSVSASLWLWPFVSDDTWCCTMGLPGTKEFFYLTTYSTHFIYGYMASDIWWRTIQIARDETCCRHSGYSFRLAARVLLYASSHRQDSTYHGLIPMIQLYNGLAWNEGHFLFNDALNTFFLRLYGVRHMVKDHSNSERGRKEMFYLTMHSTHFVYGGIGHIVKDQSNSERGRKEMLYLTMHSTHFFYGYMESDIW